MSNDSAISKCTDLCKFWILLDLNTPTLVIGWEPDSGPFSVDFNLAGNIANAGSWSQGPNLQAPGSLGLQVSGTYDITGTKRHVLLAEGYFYGEKGLGSQGDALKYGGGAGYTFSYRDDKLHTRQTSSLGINVNFFRETGSFGASSFQSNWFTVNLTAGFKQW